MKTQIMIVGGGLGGCAGALAALEAGRSVILTEPTPWLGGQASQQAVPPDENWLIEDGGCNDSYQRYREGVRAYYRQWFPLTRDAVADPKINPGGGWVSPISHLPGVTAAVLAAMLAPHIVSGRLQLWHGWVPVAADVQGDRIRRVTVQGVDGSKRDVEATVFIDASETGDLLPLAGCEYVTGCEGRDAYDEPHASARADPMNMQAVTWCFAVSLDEGDHTVDRPGDYDFWREYVPPVTPAWPGKLLDWCYSDPRTLRPREGRLTAGRPQAKQPLPFWGYRQVLDPSLFDQSRGAALASMGDASCPGVTVVNWPQNDYIGGPLYDHPHADYHARQAKSLSRSLLYWLQTEAPRPDGAVGYPGLRLRPDLMGTDDGFAMMPYIRESRRIRAVVTVTEHDVSRTLRGENAGADQFDDAVGIGAYHIDLHCSTGGDNFIDIPSLPFQIPLRALVPVRLKNLLPGCKNIGVSHIANGCYRLHPVEWAIGEAAGVLADAMCEGESAHAIAGRVASRRLLQQRLTARGVPLSWGRVPGFCL